MGDAIESRVREGYLWCGLTFVIPPLLGLPIWAIGRWIEARNFGMGLLLCASAIAGAGYAAWRTHQTSKALRTEGLDDLGRAMQRLGFALAAASAIFWITVDLLWVVR